MPVLATFSNTGEEGAAQRLRLSHESSAGVRGDVIVHCLASGSALLESDRAWVIGEQIDFNFADSAIGIVFWTSGKLAICVFDQAISDATLALEILSRSEEHTSELQSLMRISYAVFCLQKTK